MEYIETDLDQLMKHQIDFTEHHLLKVIYNSLLAISFLHLCNVMHRDVKPANILLDSKCHVKICDFGLARYLSHIQDFQEFIRFVGPHPFHHF